MVRMVWGILLLASLVNVPDEISAITIDLRTKKRDIRSRVSSIDSSRVIYAEPLPSHTFKSSLPITLGSEPQTASLPCSYIQSDESGKIYDKRQKYDEHRMVRNENINLGEKRVDQTSSYHIRVGPACNDQRKLGQLGDRCNPSKPCDTNRGLTCSFHADHTISREGNDDLKDPGVCRESGGIPCVVYNRTFEHGETFTLDCRTQCACQNGTYGCSSLCPQEHISPKGSCQHPRLVEVPGQCCREWMCDSQSAEQPPPCKPAFSMWSECNSECGGGLSSRQSNLNGRCQPDLETRLCQIRRCQDTVLPLPAILHHRMQHHLRRGHECKATHRLSSGVYLRFGPCRSRKRFRPKYCGLCPVAGVVCKPTLSTTVKVEFLCQASPHQPEDISDLLPEYLEPGEDLWTDEGPEKTRRRYLGGSVENEEVVSKLMTVSVQWVLKCRCEPERASATADGGDKDDGLDFGGGEEDLLRARPTSGSGQVILHRVHRTAAP